MSARRPATADLARVMTLLAGWRSEHGITAHQAEVLVHVHVAGAATCASLCRSIGLSTASMTRLVARLEAGGWLLRLPDDADARRIILQPTKQALRAMEQLELRWERNAPQPTHEQQPERRSRL